MNDALPPVYAMTPVTVLYAEADDALVLTMSRLVGLCWTYGYERTPALTPEQLAALTGRPRSTLYRHLKQLREMQWIRVDRAGRRMIICPLIACSAGAACGEAGSAPGGPPGSEPDGEPAPDEALLQALADIGVGNPKRSQLACLGIDPLWVRAWQLWAEHPHRRGLANPVGQIIRKLESGERPPGAFLRAAEEQARLRRWAQEQTDRAEDQAGLEEPSQESEGVPLEARRLWTRSLDELQLQMTRATFDTWLRGSEVVAAGEGCLTVKVHSVYAVDWLQHRLLGVVERTVKRQAGGQVKVAFVAGA